MSIEETARDLRVRIKADMIGTVREHQGNRAFVSGPMIDALADDAMYYIEDLLIRLALTESKVVEHE